MLVFEGLLSSSFLDFEYLYVPYNGGILCSL